MPNRQHEDSIDRYGYTLKSSDCQEHIPGICKKSNLTANFVLLRNVKNVNETTEMPRYRIISRPSAVDNVGSANDKNVDRINFDVPDQIIIPNIKALRVTFSWEIRQMYYARQVMCFTQGLD